MNYSRIYHQLMVEGKLTSKSQYAFLGIYAEKHHIVPKCMGGVDTEDNFTILTARQHFLAHWLLHKMYPESKGLALAFHSFCMHKSKRGIRVTSRMFASMRKAFNEANIGWKHSDTARAKMSAARKGRPATNRGVSYSAEQRAKMSAGRRGKGVGRTGAKCPRYKGAVIATSLTDGSTIHLCGEIDMEARGFDSGHISKCLSGKASQHKGYTFTRENYDGNS